jgi:hypothetical protein
LFLRSIGVDYSSAETPTANRADEDRGVGLGSVVRNRFKASSIATGVIGKGAAIFELVRRQVEAQKAKAS